MRDLYCIAELSKRLEQEPGKELFKPIREDTALRLKYQLDQNGMPLRLFMTRNNLDVDSLNRLLDDHAMAEARSQAALAAFAAERGIAAGESEWADLLGLPKDVARDLFNKARGTEKYDSYARAAVNAKALRTVVAEADCTIVHEAADEARRRVAGERQRRGLLAFRARPPKPALEPGVRVHAQVLDEMHPDNALVIYRVIDSVPPGVCHSYRKGWQGGVIARVEDPSHERGD